MSRTSINSAIEAAKHPILLGTPAQLEEAWKIWARRSVLGIDTEFVRERTYRAELGLVQVSDGDTAWLIDPLALESLEPLARLLKHPGIVKILHSGSEDLEVLLQTTGVVPAPLIDTQVACAMLGQPLQLGYHHAVKWLFGVGIDKDQTRSNWCKRPLHARQLLYAAMDVVLLPMMYATLKSRLEDAGRWDWLEEDVERMRRAALESIDPDMAYLRFSGTGRMDDQTLKVLRGLSRWREQTAIDRNRARGFVINDAGLLQMARSKPATAAKIRKIEDIHPGALARYEKTLLEIIADAPSDPVPVEKLEQLDDRQRKLLNEMRSLVQKLSASLGVDPALLASRRELQKLIRAVAAGQPPPERFLGWRKEILSDQLLAIAEGKH
ncbi:MAG: ribonuclease D [Gammaproteobacteria bacterium]|jgi:ribonuclease D|nr:ribonuclease D [Gammaproteobacteria bacterium]